MPGGKAHGRGAPVAGGGAELPAAGLGCGPARRLRVRRSWTLPNGPCARPPRTARGRAGPHARLTSAAIASRPVAVAEGEARGSASAAEASRLLQRSLSTTHTHAGQLCLLGRRSASHRAGLACPAADRLRAHRPSMAARRCARGRLWRASMRCWQVRLEAWPGAWPLTHPEKTWQGPAPRNARTPGSMAGRSSSTASRSSSSTCSAARPTRPRPLPRVECRGP